MDCLTGNTDRHQDNWGLIVKGVRELPKEKWPLHFSPAFDNGTALGYEVVEKNIEKCLNEERLEKYLTNPRHARHHMKWSLDENEPLNFYEFMQKFVLEFPDTMSIIVKHLDFGRSQVEEIMSPLVTAVSDSEVLSKSEKTSFYNRVYIQA